ncbi:hypothetical protein SAY86_014960 [Trapa natans]|uniref:Uncharacterized protein n=1 Tax=Trapa natans TaxID=22666 RepID=A0AAN7QJX5_TRANT|nr:hypothetical protein SAY86_014960 [Trapa natans]
MAWLAELVFDKMGKDIKALCTQTRQLGKSSVGTDNCLQFISLFRARAKESCCLVEKDISKLYTVNVLEPCGCHEHDSIHEIVIACEIVQDKTFGDRWGFDKCCNP